MRKHGFFEIGVYHPKHECNIGTLWRTAYQLGASGIYTIGARYDRQATDTTNAPAKIPLREWDTIEDYMRHLPSNMRLVAVEMGGQPLETITHHECCSYLLGAEDHGLPDTVIKHCNQVISLSAVNVESYNVALAGGMVMYHRMFL